MFRKKKLLLYINVNYNDCQYRKTLCTSIFKEQTNCETVYIEKISYLAKMRTNSVTFEYTKRQTLNVP